MWHLPTLNNFSTWIDWHLEKAIKAAKMAVRDVKAEFAMHNAVGSSAMELSIFDAVYTQFEEGIAKALGEARRATEMIHFEIEDIERITKERLLSFSDQMKLVCCPAETQQSPLYKPANVINLNKFDELREFMLSQFAVGFLVPPKPEMPPSMKNDIKIGTMYGGAIQQGTTASNQTVRIQIDARAAQEAIAGIEAGLQGITDDRLSDIQNDLETIKAQLRKRQPSPSILAETFGSLRNVAEGIFAGAVTSPVVGWVQDLGRALGVA